MTAKREREITRAWLAGLSMESCAWVFGLKQGTIERLLLKNPKPRYWRTGKR